MSTLSHRRCWVEVDGRALRHNYRVLRSLVPRTTKLLAVVKANAYGHGLIPMAKELEVIGANWLGDDHHSLTRTIRWLGSALVRQRTTPIHVLLVHAKHRNTLCEWHDFEHAHNQHETSAANCLPTFGVTTE